MVPCGGVELSLHIKLALRPSGRSSRGVAQLVARTAGGREVAGSSPVTPTIIEDAYMFDTILNTAPKLGRCRLIAIDGHGGSGKSTLAELLARDLKAEIIHTDDFAGW